MDIAQREVMRIISSMREKSIIKKVTLKNIYVSIM